MTETRNYWQYAILAVVLGWISPGYGAVPTAELEAIRAGGGGTELSGLVVATIDARGRLKTAAQGCARFAVDGRRCALPLRTNGIMRIASISKLVTAAEVVRRVRQGRLSLDQDVSLLAGFKLRNPAFPDQPITLRQLLNHTSSIIDQEQYWLPWPQRLDGHTVSTHRFDAAHAPGQYFRYSNFNFVLLGQILERRIGRRFSELMARGQFRRPRIDAGYNWRDMRRVDADRVVTLYRRQLDHGTWIADGPWYAQVDDFAGGAPTVAALSNYQPGDNASVFSPHGGLRIALPDLARWLSALDRETFADMRANPFVLNPDGSNGDSESGFYRSFGLGIHSSDIPGIGEVWGHFGEAYGLRAAVLRDPHSPRVWAYAVTGFGADPDRDPSQAVRGLDPAQQAVLRLLGRGL